MLKSLFASIAVLLSASLPVHAQAVLTCEVIDGHIPVGQNFPTKPEPAQIVGERTGSRVNVRTGPGSEYEATAYGLVGDQIHIIGQAFSNRCDTWIQVRFPVSGHVGWIHSDFIDGYYGIGWWD